MQEIELFIVLFSFLYFNSKVISSATLIGAKVLYEHEERKKTDVLEVIEGNRTLIYRNMVQ